MSNEIINKHFALFAKQEGTEGTANAPAATDAILAEAISPKLPLAVNERSYQGVPGSRAGAPGAQLDTGVSFTTEIKGDGSTTIPEIDELAQACFGKVAAANLDTTTSGAGSTTTVLQVADATNASVGSGVLVEISAGVYEVAWITAVNTAAAPDEITVAPALSTAPNANGRGVKEMRTYQIALPTALANSMTFDLYKSAGAGVSRRDRLVGARGNVKMPPISAGDIPKLAWDFMAWSWSQVTDATRPAFTFDPALPKAALASKFKVNGVLVNAYDIGWDLGAVIAKKTSPNADYGVCGTPHVNYDPVGEFKIHPAFSSIAEFTAWLAGTTMALSQQFGNTPFNTWGWYCPAAQRVEVADGDDNGLGTNEIKWRAATQNNADPVAITPTGPAQFYLAVG